ncbi:MAG TPA: hypothetical protein VHV10_21375 [Ktedonobacteraceae bacterium]|nr:hypothetical protein [Ktedonobacteraceae bacterium]
MKKRLMLTALLVLFLFSGCGGSNSPSDTSQPQTASGGGSPSPSYLNDNADTEVLYIQWTESNGQFTGSWNDAILQTGTIVYTSLPITGTYNSSTGTVNFVRRNTDGSDTPISGTLQDNKLVLLMQQNGLPVSWTLHTVIYVDYQSQLNKFKANHPGS